MSGDSSGEAPPRAELTRVLSEIERGAPRAAERLLELVYGELRRIAAAKLASREAGNTLQPTALVHEAYLRLLGGHAAARTFKDSAHFFTAAAAAMRSILVDHARARKALKRGGAGARVTLHPDLAGECDPLDRILDVHAALARLAEEHARPARVVELLFFAGLTVDEAALALGVSDRTVKRDWRFGRAWLLRALEAEA